VDAVVVNRVGREGSGFGSDTNEAAIVRADGRDTGVRTWTKSELAASICDLLARSMGS
jgi:phosphopantothenoylcysteine synthetase/decarboxylase